MVNGEITRYMPVIYYRCTALLVWYQFVYRGKFRRRKTTLDIVLTRDLASTIYKHMVLIYILS